MYGVQMHLQMALESRSSVKKDCMKLQDEIATLRGEIINLVKSSAHTGPSGKDKIDDVDVDLTFTEWRHETGSPRPLATRLKESEDRVQTSPVLSSYYLITITVLSQYYLRTISVLSQYYLSTISVLVKY